MGGLMASLSHDKNGGRRVQFIAPDGSRPAIYLGKVSRKAAEAFRDNVGQLRACYGHPEAIPADLLRWAIALEDGPYGILARADLLPVRKSADDAPAPTLGRLIADLSG